MDLSVREAARLLDVTEDRVYHWIRKGEIPAHRVGEQYWFHRVELQEWAASHKLRVSPEVAAPAGGMAAMPSLRAALERGGVFYDVPGDRRDTALEAVTQLRGIPDTIARNLLLELLISRESLASTGMGDGIAIPHPRDPVVLPIDESIVLLCFLAHDVDFGAMDGQPTRVLFLLLSPTIRAHLQMLSRVAFAAHDDTFKGLLRTKASRHAILDRLGAIEAEPQTTGKQSKG